MSNPKIPGHYSTHPDYEEEILLGLLYPSLDPGSLNPPTVPGADLPIMYWRDWLCLMVQSPYRLYVYWELTTRLLKRVMRRFPRNDWGSFRLTLRCLPEQYPPSPCLDVGITRHWWFEVLPATTYRAQLCLSSPEYGLYPILTSQPVETPRDHIMPPSADQSPKWLDAPTRDIPSQESDIPQGILTAIPTPINLEPLLLPMSQACEETGHSGETSNKNRGLRWTSLAQPGEESHPPPHTTSPGVVFHD
jgi:hypothetical protein